LDAWQLASELRDKTSQLTKTPDFARNSWLRSQLMRATQSACSNIAEGFGRYQPRDFARFLRISRGSLTEAQEHLESARQVGLIGESELRDLVHLANRAIGAITRLVRYLERAKAP
jgi:four helix bundle protein